MATSVKIFEPAYAFIDGKLDTFLGDRLSAVIAQGSGPMRVTLALLVALGPIFIACALFDVTRRFFFGWLSQAVNYVVLMALIITVFQMILSLVADQWSQIDSPDPIVGGLIFIVLCILGAIFF